MIGRSRLGVDLSNFDSPFSLSSLLLGKSKRMEVFSEGAGSRDGVLGLEEDRFFGFWR
ncbi:unnamed protein product [Linum tenue]|uniref:Uncharacterized protein n=1 Tax=Linum tenue TaxID=586396 RepID=A0AAV0L8I3_9ROSI|nr:unnamed protein product [Linum tenue]CAI0430566.1 unnamed protein product [Linum tenue]